MRKNAIYSKSLEFAVRIVNLYDYLRKEKQEYIISKQMMRSGTSIGANVVEAQDAQSDPDFISKLSIALKECRETRYWLLLLLNTSRITLTQYESIDKDASEINALLVSIIKTKKKLYNEGAKDR